MHLKIAARKSDLARLQAYRVGEALKQAHPQISIEYLFSTSLGDQNQSDPLWQMPEKGVFTEDLTKKLIAGECSLVVHSWKDLPVEERDKTEIAATLPREDARDLILFRREVVANKPAQLTVLSSSPRRALSVGEFLSWALPFSTSVQFQSVRGNIQTRVRKLMAGEAGALVVAKAAFDRLLESHEDEFAETRRVLREALEKCLWMVVPLSQNPGAAAQGALAIEVRRGDEVTKNLLKAVHCESTFRNVSWERRRLKEFGGGCHQKIGITRLSRPYGKIIFERGQTDAGYRLETVRMEAVQIEAASTGAPGQLYPLRPSEDALFDRENIAVHPSQFANRDLFIPKGEALPAGGEPAWTQLVWVSGVQTWKRLAARGVWVSGTQDSMGEDDSDILAIGSLLGRAPRFLKLSHDRAGEWSTGEVLATYKLIPKDQVPALQGKTHFYWMSASAFSRALELNPQIRAARHACGPGHTYKFLKKTLGPKASIEVHLSHGAWLKAYTDGTNGGRS
jgi:hydroxymethylbilane synthase